MSKQDIITVGICLEKLEEVKTSGHITKTQVYDIIHNKADVKAQIIKSLLGRAMTPYDIDSRINDLGFCEQVAVMLNICRRENVVLYGGREVSKTSQLY